MNIDDLSKSQLLLLTLLVNFVMSIATGIVTVSLLDVAPTTVTQTVDRIVEHTVDTVAPAATTGTAAAAAADPQPSEEDQLISAVSGDEARTVSLYVNSTTTPAAEGIYLPKSRAVVVLRSDSLPQNANVLFANGATSAVSISHSGDTIVIYGFSDTATLPDAPATSLLAAADLKQGQAVIGLTADGSAVTGIVSKIDGTTITTTLPQTPAGAAAVDLKGELVGISTGTDGAYISSDVINTLLSAPVTAPGT